MAILDLGGGEVVMPGARPMGCGNGGGGGGGGWWWW